MKIRHPALIRAAGWLGARLLRAWMGTLRHHCRPLGPEVFPDRPGRRRPFIYAFWHEALLLPAYRYARPDVCVLVSTHADGELIAAACRHLGVRAVRGSSTRGGTNALWEMIQAGEKYHLAVTPDGPRGPRRVVRPGLVYLAARTGLPVAPLGIAYGRAWRARSWDRFALPRPFTGAYLVSGEPVAVPPEAGPEDLEPYRARVQAELDRATRVAEDWAGSGRFDPAAAERAPAARAA
ncbi:MAG TPA: lysophospholipid acyltransferase family protein [Gemmataceae bacterium]